MRLEQTKIDEIRQNSDIVAILGHYLTLQKKGRNYVSICPFHEDHDPSLSISQEKQIFKCFVCGAGGNVFQFVQRFQNIHFIEAVQTVAKLSNFALDVDVSAFKYEQREKSPILQTLVAATDFYQYQLTSQKTGPAYTYLTNRGLTADIIEHFKIGYATSQKQAITQFLSKKGFDEASILKSGVVSIQNNEMQDQFMDRILFPISNEYGEVVGFSARTMKADVKPKYINSTENDVFKKNQLLYHYFEAKQAIQSARNVYILEGMMDVIALYQADIANAVAVMGTALTKNHINLIKKVTKKVTLCFDGDNAGIAATLKTIDLLEQMELEVKVVLLDDKKDPDDLLNEKGKDYLITLLNRSISSREYEIKMLSRQLDLNNYDDKKRFVSQLMPKIMKIKDPLDYDFLVGQLEQMTGFRKTTLEKEYQQIQVNPVFTTIQDYERTSVDTRFVRAEKELLWYMCKSSQACQLYFDELGVMYQTNHRRLANAILDYYRQHETFGISDFLSSLNDEILISEMTDIAYLGDALPEVPSTQALKEYIHTINGYATQQQVKSLKQKMKEAQSLSDKTSIAQELISLEKELKK